MTSLQSSEGLGEAMRLAPRLPGLCLKLQLRQGHGDVCRNVYRPWTLGVGMFQRLNGEVPSSSFLPACNYSVIAQSGFVGVDVYTHAIVQDLGGEQNADLHCKCSRQIWA